ncbi:MAG: hypothetical protein CMH52_01140 [Myxococcales bacterium]|nr:hypothetical protein [Myxococcales bacterium]
MSPSKALLSISVTVGIYQTQDDLAIDCLTSVSGGRATVSDRRTVFQRIACVVSLYCVETMVFSDVGLTGWALTDDGT